MNITYLSLNDTQDVHEWSGLDYYISKSIENQGANVTYLNNLGKVKVNSFSFRKNIYKLFGKKFPLNRMPEYAKKIATGAMHAIDLIPANNGVLFSPTSLFFSYLESEIPKVFYSDATFQSMLNFYPAFKNLSKESIKNGNRLEKEALMNCDLALYASHWAADSAINFYGADPKKVKVVPFGANIDTQTTLTEVAEAIENKDMQTCHLLFVGVDWERKGGYIALKTAELLNKMGLPCFLHLVGVPTIPIDNLPEFVKNYGFISKKTADGKQQLNDLYKKCHFLIVPSIAEAYGLVYCEANSMGLPAVATNVGGIPTIIKNNVNGMTFEPTEPASAYADYIFETFNDKNKYKNLCYSSFERYQKELNWDVAGKTILNHIIEIN